MVPWFAVAARLGFLLLFVGSIFAHPATAGIPKPQARIPKQKHVDAVQKARKILENARRDREANNREEALRELDRAQQAMVAPGVLPEARASVLIAIAGELAQLKSDPSKVLDEVSKTANSISTDPLTQANLYIDLAFTWTASRKVVGAAVALKNTTSALEKARVAAKQVPEEDRYVTLARIATEFARIGNSDKALEILDEAVGLAASTTLARRAELDYIIISIAGNIHDRAKDFTLPQLLFSISPRLIKLESHLRAIPDEKEAPNKVRSALTAVRKFLGQLLAILIVCLIIGIAITVFAVLRYHQGQERKRVEMAERRRVASTVVRPSFPPPTNSGLLHEATIWQLLQLSFFRDGVIPEVLRTRLLEQFTDDQYFSEQEQEQLRRAFLRFQEYQEPDDSSGAAGEFLLNRATQQFALQPTTRLVAEKPEVPTGRAEAIQTMRRFLQWYPAATALSDPAMRGVLERDAQRYPRWYCALFEYNLPALGFYYIRWSTVFVVFVVAIIVGSLIAVPFTHPTDSSQSKQSANSQLPAPPFSLPPIPPPPIRGEPDPVVFDRAHLQREVKIFGLSDPYIESVEIRNSSRPQAFTARIESGPNREPNRQVLVAYDPTGRRGPNVLHETAILRMQVRDVNSPVEVKLDGDSRLPVDPPVGTSAVNLILPDELPGGVHVVAPTASRPVAVPIFLVSRDGTRLQPDSYRARIAMRGVLPTGTHWAVSPDGQSHGLGRLAFTVTYNPARRNGVDATLIEIYRPERSQDGEETARTIASGKLRARVGGPTKWPALQGLPLDRAALAIAHAEADATVREEGQKNRGPRVDQYQAAVNIMGESWCTAFVFWCVREAARRQGVSNPLPTTANVARLQQWAKVNGCLLPLGTPPAPGDIFVDTNASLDRTGFVDATINNTTLMVVMGNTNSEDDRNLIGVFYRRLSFPVGYRLIRLSSYGNKNILTTSPKDPLLIAGNHYRYKAVINIKAPKGNTIRPISIDNYNAGRHPFRIGGWRSLTSATGQLSVAFMPLTRELTPSQPLKRSYTETIPLTFTVTQAGATTRQETVNIVVRGVDPGMVVVTRQVVGSVTRERTISPSSGGQAEVRTGDALYIGDSIKTSENSKITFNVVGADSAQVVREAKFTAQPNTVLTLDSTPETTYSKTMTPLRDFRVSVAKGVVSVQDATGVSRNITAGQGYTWKQDGGGAIDEDLYRLIGAEFSGFDLTAVNADNAIETAPTASGVQTGLMCVRLDFKGNPSYNSVLRNPENYAVDIPNRAELKIRQNGLIRTDVVSVVNPSGLGQTNKLILYVPLVIDGTGEATVRVNLKPNSQAGIRGSSAQFTWVVRNPLPVRMSYYNAQFVGEKRVITISFIDVRGDMNRILTDPKSYVVMETTSGNNQSSMEQRQMTFKDALISKPGNLLVQNVAFFLEGEGYGKGKIRLLRFPADTSKPEIIMERELPWNFDSKTSKVPK